MPPARRKMKRCWRPCGAAEPAAAPPSCSKPPPRTAGGGFLLPSARVHSFRIQIHFSGAAVTELQARYERFEQVLRECGSLCIGYSGGVDSVYLAVAAVDVLGAANVLAVTGRSETYPQVQYDTAMECVERFGIPHLEIDTEEMNDPRYAANPVNRCYFCKTELWSKVWLVACAVSV